VPSSSTSSPTVCKRDRSPIRRHRFHERPCPDLRRRVHRADAIAVTGDRIAGVGSDKSVLALAGPETRVVALSGRTVIPGIIDAHAHMEREGLKQLRLSLAGLATVREILDRIAAEAARTPKGQWIVTMPVGEPPYYFGGPNTLAEKRMPDRHELDRAAPDHPVCISGVFGNWGRPPGYTALNTLALRLNGIGPRTKPACSGVVIERDASGEPTGIIVEHNNRPTVEFDLLPAVPKFSAADRLEGIRGRCHSTTQWARRASTKATARRRRPSRATRSSRRKAR
jgi:predicted amidohydrolase YtcJ